MKRGIVLNRYATCDARNDVRKQNIIGRQFL